MTNEETKKQTTPYKKNDATTTHTGKDDSNLIKR